MRLAAGILLTHFLTIILLITLTQDSPEHKQSRYLDIPSFPLRFKWLGRHPPRKELCLAKTVKQTCCSVLKLVCSTDRVFCGLTFLWFDRCEHEMLPAFPPLDFCESALWGTRRRRCSCRPSFHLARFVWDLLACRRVSEGAQTVMAHTAACK